MGAFFTEADMAGEAPAGHGGSGASCSIVARQRRGWGVRYGEPLRLNGLAL